MTEANLAYEKGDENRLRELLDEYNSNRELVAGNNVGAELVRTIRKISLATAKIKKVETELHEMNTSELAKLRATVTTTWVARRDTKVSGARGSKRSFGLRKSLKTGSGNTSNRGLMLTREVVGSRKGQETGKSCPIRIIWKHP